MYRAINEYIGKYAFISANNSLFSHYNYTSRVVNSFICLIPL